MSNTIDHKKRPGDYLEIVKKYRKVIPPDLSFSSNESVLLSNPKRQEVTSGLTAYNGEWGEKQILHLLRRTLFGVKKSELIYFKTLTLDEAVTSILSESQQPDAPVNDYQGIDGNDPDVGLGESWVLAPSWGEFEGLRIQSHKAWMVKNILQQEATIHEKLLLFWHNLLPIEFWGVFSAKANYHYLEMLRENSMGNYKEMIDLLSKSPAMLIYLNGTQNHKDAPDENYARELQELFCVGKGEGSQYTEEDVAAAARVLTGWVVKWESFENWGLPSHKFEPSWHDENDKSFSAFYHNSTVNGKTGNEGEQEFQELLDLIFRTDELALYVCRRIYNFFVYPQIDQVTEENMIKPLAEIFRNGNYEIKPVLDVLFRSEHFYDAANLGAMIKNPADFLLGLWRSLDLNEIQPESPQKNLQYHISHLWRMSNLGMELGDPPNVAGWPAYHQAPYFDRSWITTDTIKNRAIITDSLLFWGYWIDQDWQIEFDPIPFISNLDHPEDPNLLLKELSERLLGIPLSNEALDGLKNILLSGQTSDYYWTDAWNAYLISPTEGNRSVVLNRLKPTLQSIFQLGEFHLM